MARLRGTGLGAGTALGSAAIVQTSRGIPILPEMPHRLAALAAQRRLTETPEVILVAEDYLTALALSGSLPWAKVVGIVAEKAAQDAPLASIPAVVGVRDLMKTATEDVLILVDAALGTVLVDPDPVYLAQYTAEHDKIAPKRRYFLDEAHLPAQTLDGRSIGVYVYTTEGVSEALASGADALCHALPLTFDPVLLRRHLDELLAMTAGKPLIFPCNSSLPLEPIVILAARADISLLVPPAAGSEVIELQRLNDDIALISEECYANDTICGSPGIAAEIVYRTESDWPDQEEVAKMIDLLAAQGATRLFFTGSVASVGEMTRLESLAASATEHLIPVIFYVSDLTMPCSQDEADYVKSIRLLLGAGISGFETTPQRVELTKSAIREANISECQDLLQSWIAEEQKTRDQIE